MASEDKKPNEGSMPAKQKATIAVIAVIFLIIAWQIYGLIGGGGSSSAPQPTIAKPTVVTKELKLADSNANNATAQSNEQVSVRESTVRNSPRFNEMQARTEEKYLRKLSDLEQLKLQQQIAETNQAISAAKLATVSAEKDISNLLTAPSQSQQSEQSQLSGYSQQIQQQVAEEKQKQEEEANLIPDANYNVVSVSRSLNVWQAILSLDGKYYGVRVGDTLPPDGSVVRAINQKRVLLRKDGKNRSISMVLEVPISSTTPQSETFTQ